MRRLTDPATTLLRRAISNGVTADDEPEVRLQKSALLLIAWSVTLLSIVWVLLYLILSRPLAAAIPFSYQVATIVAMTWIARRGWSKRFKLDQIVLFLALPALLMWSLGGFVSGSAVIMWSFLGPMGALVFMGLRQAALAFGAFAALVLISGILDPWLSTNIEPLPDAVIRTFFVLNIVAVGIVALGGTVYFVYQRDQAQALLRTRSERSMSSEHAQTICFATSCPTR